MEQKENAQLNKPARDYFKKELKCDFSKVGFNFSAGELDVLAYDRKNKHFHICEGKRASNTASVGHAIGQLIGYISKIQENSYKFLEKVSKDVKLELADFSEFFLEKKAITVFFYIVLPEDKKAKLLQPAKLIINTLGDFGRSIGIFFASPKKCDLVIKPKPLVVNIRRIYKRDEFLREFSKKFIDWNGAEGLVVKQDSYPNLIQFKKKDGHSALHYEVRLLRKNKSQENTSIEIAFHLEIGTRRSKSGKKRKEKIQKVLEESLEKLINEGFDFKYEGRFGKAWSRLYTIYKANKIELDDEILNDVLGLLKKLVSVSKPLLEKINWGKQNPEKI